MAEALEEQAVQTPKPKAPVKAAEPEDDKVYKGVYKNHGLWRVRIWVSDHEVYLGHYSSKKKAASAYDQAAICLRGWDTAVREGLNLDQGLYKPMLNDLRETPFNELVLRLREFSVKKAGLR